jgi:HSP20 family protein
MLFPVIRNNNRNWLDTAFNDFFDTDWMPRNVSTAPAVNVKESEKAFTMEVAAPGIKKEFCRVHINDDGNLSIAIENKMEHKEEDKKQHYLRREFSYTNYQQNYSLPEDVNKEGISAKVENGILTVILPKMKKEETKVSRMIEIS